MANSHLKTGVEEPDATSCDLHHTDRFSLFYYLQRLEGSKQGPPEY